MSYRRIEVDPLTPAIGAEINGVDLAQPLDEQTLDEIHDAWMKHLVIFIKNLPTTHNVFPKWY